MERLHTGQVPGGDFFFFPPSSSLSLQPEEMCREQQANLGNEHGTSWKTQQPDWGHRRTRSTEGVGVPGPRPGVCAKIRRKK